MGTRNPMKNMTLWPFFQVRTPADTKQASQMSPSNPPHKYQTPKAKGMKILLRRGALRPLVRSGGCEPGDGRGCLLPTPQKTKFSPVFPVVGQLSSATPDSHVVSVSSKRVNHLGQIEEREPRRRLS